MVSSFDPHIMWKKVERVTAKTGCTSCTKRTISFEVSGFHMETRLLQRDFIFLNLFELHSFSVHEMHHSKPHHKFSTLSDFICYFSCIYWLFLAIRPWNWKAFQTNSEKVECWHGIIIWPTYHVKESREGYGKNWMHFMYKTDYLFRSIWVSYRNSSVTKGFHFFELIWTP